MRTEPALPYGVDCWDWDLAEGVESDADCNMACEDVSVRWCSIYRWSNRTACTGYTGMCSFKPDSDASTWAVCNSTGVFGLDAQSSPHPPPALPPAGYGDMRAFKGGAATYGTSDAELYGGSYTGDYGSADESSPGSYGHVSGMGAPAGAAAAPANDSSAESFNGAPHALCCKLSKSAVAWRWHPLHLHVASDDCASETVSCTLLVSIAPVKL